MASVTITRQAAEVGFFRKYFGTDSVARTALLSILLVAATVALFYQVHTHPFSDLDDGVYIVNNVHLHQLNWTTLWWSLTALNYANWIPVSWMSHAVDYQLFGADPAGHHLMNVALHAISVVLVFVVLKRATGSTARSFMVAALFAVHPLNVEPVVWIAERKTVLSMVFFLLTLGAYRWYAKEPQGSRYNVVLLLCALALAAKPQVITLPCVLLLWDYWPLQRMETPWHEPIGDPPSTIYPRKSLAWLIKEKLPLLALCLFDALLTIYTQKSVRIGLMPPFSLRLKNAIYSYWIYLSKAFWPAGLAPESPQMGRFVTIWEVLGISLLLVAISVAVIMGRRRRYLPVGWFWFLGTLVPMIGLLQPSQQGSADRFVYQAYLGLFIMICWGAADWARLRHISPAWLAGAGAILLVALTVVSNRQIKTWQDNFTVWKHAIAVNRYHWLAQDNFGMYLFRQGKTQEALEYYYRAAAINPDDGASNFQIGYHLQNVGDMHGAIARYQVALKDYSIHDDLRATIWHNMGGAYASLGDPQEARECWQKANQISVNDSEVK